MEHFAIGLIIGFLVGILFMVFINGRNRREDTIGTLHAVRLPDDTYTNLLLEPNGDIDEVLDKRDYAVVKISRR